MRPRSDMKRLTALLLVLAIACTVPAPAPITTQTPKAPQVTASEESAGTVPIPELKEEAFEETVMSEPAESALDIIPYTQLGCESLLTVEQFASSCNNVSDEFTVTYKVGTRNCFVNIKAKKNERLTAGITLTALKDGTTAMTEFERRLKVFNVGADKSVGERAYEFPKQDRATINFVRDEFIVEVGSDTRLCSKEGLLAVAKTVDRHID